MARIEIKVPDWLDRICAWPVVVYRRRKYGYPFRRISLGQGKFTIVDPQDFYQFNIFNWCPRVQGQNIYAVRFTGDTKKNNRVISLHREIMNAPKGLLVDHRNNDSSDNHRGNLRIATAYQNGQNRRIKKKETAWSQFVGIYFDKGRRNWIYQVRANGKLVSTGRFATEIEAARARDRAAIKYHGEFARLNFPKEDYINEIRNTNDA